MHIGDLSGTLSSVDGEVADFNLKTQRNDVEAAKLGSPASGPLDGSDQPSTNQSLE